MSGAGESVVCVLVLTLGNLYTAGQDVELPMSFEDLPERTEPFRARDGQSSDRARTQTKSTVNEFFN